MKRLTNVLFVVAITALVGGCAAPPIQMASPEMDAAAKQFLPSPDRATIYVIRDSWKGAAVGMHIGIDGRTLGMLNKGTYVVIRRPASQVVLFSTSAENQVHMPLTLHPGQIAFVRLEPEIGGSVLQSRLDRLSEADGQEAVRGTQRAVLPMDWE